MKKIIFLLLFPLLGVAQKYTEEKIYAEEFGVDKNIKKLVVFKYELSQKRNALALQEINSLNFQNGLLTSGVTKNAFDAFDIMPADKAFNLKKEDRNAISFAPPEAKKYSYSNGILTYFNIRNRTIKVTEFADFDNDTKKYTTINRLKFMETSLAPSGLLVERGLGTVTYHPNNFIESVVFETKSNSIYSSGYVGKETSKWFDYQNDKQVPQISASNYYKKIITVLDQRLYEFENNRVKEYLQSTGLGDTNTYKYLYKNNILQSTVLTQKENGTVFYEEKTPYKIVASPEGIPLVSIYKKPYRATKEKPRTDDDFMVVEVYYYEDINGGMAGSKNGLDEKNTKDLLALLKQENATVTNDVADWLKTIKKTEENLIEYIYSTPPFKMESGFEILLNSTTKKHEVYFKEQKCDWLVVKKDLYSDNINVLLGGDKIFTIENWKKSKKKENIKYPVKFSNISEKFNSDFFKK